MDVDVNLGLAVLERTPVVLRVMLAGLPSAWTDATEGDGSWSPYVIVGHLIHGERTDWIPRAREAQFRESQGCTLEELLDEFARLRAENLATLADWRLTPAQLTLTGVHPAFGEVTLAQLLATWVAHDLGHIAQVARVMARQYRDAVGPWRAYLPIMDR